MFAFDLLGVLFPHCVLGRIEIRPSKLAFDP
jgi:hypothetical protein